MVASNEGITIDDESLHVIAHKADGAMRDALTIFDQTVAFCGTDVKYQDVLRNLNVLDYEYSFSLVDAFLKGDYPSALLAFDEILTKGFNALHFVAALSSHMRDLIVSKSGGLEALLELPDSLKKRYKEQSDRCQLQFLYDALAITTQCESGYRASVNPRLHIEFALMRLSFLAVKPAQQPMAAAPAQPQPVAVAPAQPLPKTAAPAPAVQPAPVPTPAPEVQPVTVAQPAPVSPSPVQPAADDTQPRERRTRAGRSAAALSMKAVMEGTQATASPLQNQENPVPSDEVLQAKWPELSQQYADKPRLASMLSSSTLKISGNDESKMVVFRVVNEAQKEWVELKLLHELEGRYRALVGCSKVCLRVEVVPDDAPKTEVVYMPSEQAKRLMDSNPDVNSLVKDLGLEIR